MEIILIAAIDENKGIGYKNQLLKKIPEDLKRFKEKTSNHVVLMGKNTWDSLPIKPLPNRINCVITRDHTKKEEYERVGSTVESSLKYLQEKKFKKVFVIGGGKTYAAALPFATKLDITHIKGKHKADCFFPDFESDFTLENKEIFGDLEFCTYVKKNKKI